MKTRHSIMNVIKYKWIDTANSSQWQEVRFNESQLTLIEFKRYIIYVRSVLDVPPSQIDLTVCNHVTGEYFRDDNWVLPLRSLFSVRPAANAIGDARWKTLQQEPNWNNLSIHDAWKRKKKRTFINWCSKKTIMPSFRASLALALQWLTPTLIVSIVEHVETGATWPTTALIPREPANSFGHAICKTL